MLVQGSHADRVTLVPGRVRLETVVCLVVEEALISFDFIRVIIFVILVELLALALLLRLLHFFNVGAFPSYEPLSVEGIRVLLLHLGRHVEVILLILVWRPCGQGFDFLFVGAHDVFVGCHYNDWETHLLH